MKRAFNNFRGLEKLLAKEWLFLGSFLGLAVTSVVFRRLPVYSEKEFQVVVVLFAFFITVKGLERSNLMLRISRMIESGRYVEMKFVLATFLLSMFVTNDVALVILVPLTLLIHVKKKGIVVILEALAANAGSALTPFGNPQNLFIYWVYGVPPVKFIACIAPFSLFFLILILWMAWLLREEKPFTNSEVVPVKINRNAYSYLILLILLILVILHLLPVYMILTVIFYALVFDRKSLKIDYALLLTFVCFFGLADNLKNVFSTEIKSAGDIFLYTAGISQIISNVPATLLLSKYTSYWKSLLWGSNVGGFGTLVASLANLIAYKQYVSHDVSKGKKASFTFLFLAMGFAALLIGTGLYFLIKIYI